MKALIDASAIIDFMHGDENLRKIISEVDEIFVSSLTAYEVLVGEKEGKRATETDAFLDEFISVSFEKQHMKKACEISRILSKKGKMINLIDLMVAGQALSIGAAIITNDRDYEHVSDISELKTIFVR
jgi:predicted nucleic acid-binding protein